MSRLPSHHYSSKIQPELIPLLHDKVISLCQHQYGSVEGLEIDGIICISLLDTKEQQVVKIHKTLKSIIPQKSAYPNITNILSKKNDTKETPVQLTLASSQKTKESNELSLIKPPEKGLELLAKTILENGNKSQHSSKEQNKEHNFQQDVTLLHDILRNSDHPTTESVSKAREERVSKRKIKAPKHHIQETVAKAHSEERTEEITVKEEPCDPDYDKAFEPKIVSVFGGGKIDSGKHDSILKGNKTMMPVSSYIHSLIDKEIHSSAGESGKNGELVKEGEVQHGNNNQEVTIKVEPIDNNKEVQDGMMIMGDDRTRDNQHATGSASDSDEESHDNNADDDDKDYDVNYEEMDERIKEWLYQDFPSVQTRRQRYQQQQEEKHWLYGIARSRQFPSHEVKTNESVRLALADKVQSSKIYTRPPSPPPRQIYDVSGLTWIERVKQNVNKYQAALMRSSKEKTGAHETSAPDSSLHSLPSTSGVKPSTQNTDFLKALLQAPPASKLYGASSVLLTQGASNIATEMDLAGVGRSSRARSEPFGHQERSRSLSPAPVVKIEVDEDSSPYTSGTDASSSNPAKVPAPKVPGKLESRYPALFNQLQQVKKGNYSFESGDSLVHRLPFISFQELFSQATTSSSGTASKPTDKPAETSTVPLQTMERKRQDRITPLKKRTVWKWKKRFVRPKDEQGKPLSSIPLSPAEFVPLQETAKTFTKKRTRMDEDKPYTPYKSRKIVEKLLSEVSEETNSSTVRTRLSSGEKKKINFAEIDDSDDDSDDIVIESLDKWNDEEDGNNSAGSSKMELVSAYCSNNCGAMFANINELQEHEKDCMNTGANGIGSVARQYRCTLCGLEFNQSYRLHYHMVKVHQVAVDENVPFR